MTDFADLEVADSIVLSDVLAESTPLPFSSFRDAILLCPADANAGTATIYVSHKKDGTYYPLRTPAGIVADTVAIVASIARQLPESIRAAAWVKLVSSVAQTGQFIVLFKS